MIPTLVRIGVSRLVAAIPMIFIVVTATFILIRAVPGDPTLVLAGDAPTPQYIELIRESYGLDQPVLSQYVRFLSRAASGDLGNSIYYQRPVLEVILDRLPATLLLTVSALTVATVFGVAIAMWAARKPGSGSDMMISSLSLIGYSIPTFWIGQILILVFAINLGWLPAGGMENARHNYSGLKQVQDIFLHSILPVASLSVLLMTMIARFTRTALIEELSKDYVTVARAKGATEIQVLWRHAFRVAATTTVTIVGLEFGIVIAGTVLVETIFSWPGLGRLFYDAITRRDFPLLTGAFIFTSVMIVMINMVTDLVCAVLDPRIQR